MDTQDLTTCRKRNGKQVSFEFKIFVISQINNGQISLNYAAKKYDISRSTIEYWRKKLSNYSSKNKSMSKDQEIKKLKKSWQIWKSSKIFNKILLLNLRK